MSTQIRDKQQWDQLKSFPFKYFTQPFPINSDEFIVASIKNNYHNGDGIYKFNINKNEWCKIFDYDSNLKYTLFSSAYDNENKLLYAGASSLDNPPRFLVFDLNTKNKVTSKQGQYNIFFKFIFIENKLHQICNLVQSGSTIQNGDHYIYNSEKQFDKITTFKPLKYLNDYGLIYLKSKKAVILFGGYKYGVDDQNSIFVFSTIDSTWKELNIKLPMKLSSFGLVSTKNEQYVIILGGYCGDDSDNIFIYNTRNNTFIKSKIKCPKKGQYHAIMINNSNRDETVSYGFVNACFKNEKFINMQLLPEYLIKTICCYYCYEEIHLLKITGNGKHWKMNIDYILQ